jgi:hypothetical protein
MLLKVATVGRNIQCAYASVVEILAFKAFEGFKKQVACETDNN